MTHIVDTRTIVDSISFLQRVCAKGPDEERLIAAVANLRRALSTPLNTGQSAVVIPSANNVSK
jgi:hypothetical protein